jgi:hypothetical protein
VIYGADKQPINVSTSSTEAPWLPLWVSWFAMFVTCQGRSPGAATRLHPWVSTNPVFQDIVVRHYWVPMSPFLKGNDPETKRLNLIMGFMREEGLFYLWFSILDC